MASKLDPQLPKSIHRAFLKAWEGFPTLHSHEMWVRYANMKNMTMRAQPVLNQNFFMRKARAYKIEVQPHPEFAEGLQLEKLDHNILVGWFAHELGHVMDYQQRSWLNLIKMGIAYALLPTFRIGAERKADLLAVEMGFGPYLQATKKFILEESDIPDRYLSRINKYYLSPQELQVILDERS